MRKLIFFTALLILPVISCSEFTESTLTITNNCTASVSVHYSYIEDGIYYGDTITLDIKKTKEETIYSKDALVTVQATKGTKYASYYSSGGDFTVIMVDENFQ